MAEARSFLEIKFGIPRPDNESSRFPDGRVVNHHLFQHADAKSGEEPDLKNSFLRQNTNNAAAFNGRVTDRPKELPSIPTRSFSEGPSCGAKAFTDVSN